MSDDDHMIELEPVAVARTRRKQIEAAADAMTAARPAKASAADELAASIAKAFVEAQGQTNHGPPVRYGEDDQSEVWLIANRHFHVDARCQAYSQIAGTAYGVEGMGLKVNVGDRFAVRERFVSSFVDSGYARLAAH